MVLESLESRRLMSGTLVVHGTPGVDNIVITEEASEPDPVTGEVTQISVTVHTGVDPDQTYFGGIVDKIVVHLGKESDSLQMDLRGTSAIVNGGDGDDILIGTVESGSEIQFFGNNGRDQLLVFAAHLDTVVSFLGGNDDDSAVYIGDGTFNFDGGSGDDTLDLGIGDVVTCRVENGIV
jgi:Ca2+-binding RTX toxin-like protein